MNRINSLIGSPSVCWRGYPIILYTGFPTGINSINSKKKNKIIPIINIRGFYIGLLTLPSNVVYPQSYDGYYKKKGPCHIGLMFITEHPKYQ